MGVNRRSLQFKVFALKSLFRLLSFHFEHRWGYQIHVIAGSNVRGEGEHRYMSKWLPHPYYNDTVRNSSNLTVTMKGVYDIALIKLESKFTKHLNDGRHYLINTICLPTRDSSAYVPGEATYFGYGTIERSIPVGPWSHDLLLKGNVKLRPWGQCNYRYCTHYDNGAQGKPCSVS